MQNLSVYNNYNNNITDKMFNKNKQKFIKMDYKRNLISFDNFIQMSKKQ